MYRTDRFSRVEHAERGPFVFAVIAVMVLGVAISCATGHEKTKEENKTPAPPPTLGGEIAQPDHTMQQSGPQTVTFAAAVDAYSKRRYREAAASFEDYTQRHPASASGHYMLGLSAWKSGDLARARLAFERSLELDSTNVKTLLNLGRVLLDQGQPGEALVRIGSAAALDSGSAEVQRMMGRVQTARGQRDSAMTSYRTALSIDPADSWSMNNLGLLLIDEGRYEEALPPLARAVELRPEAPAFANNLGVALERTGHPSAAADAFRSALKADSTYVKATRSLARVEEKAKSDSTVVDVSQLAATFNQEIQATRRTDRLAKEPDGDR